MAELIEEAYKRAIKVLEKDSTPYGFLASVAGYLEVWARDSCVTLLGADLTKNKTLIKTSERALNTLGKYQSELGQIPNNVKPPKMRIDFGEAGSTDATLWYIIGGYYHYKAAGDEKFLKSHWPRAKRGILWARYQDCNNCGLIEVPESGDWADLFSNYHNVLYDEVLYYGALRACVEMAKEMGEDFSKFRSLADDVKKKVNLLMWVDGSREKEIKRTNLIWLVVHHKMNVELGSRPYYLPYVSFRDFGHRCDVYANLLAVIFGVADEERRTKIMKYLDQVNVYSPYPVRVLHPPIFEGEKGWKDFFKSANLNLPYQYHNGGVWPYVGGFWVASLVNNGEKDRAEENLAKLASANKLGVSEWEFNEWLHGLTGKPMGFPFQAWSAGMYLFAYHVVKRGTVALL